MILVYAAMADTAPRTALVKRIRLGDNGSLTDAGTLPVGPGHHVSGVVVMPEGVPIPPHAWVLLVRNEGLDGQSASVDEHGRFDFSGVPAEPVKLSINLPGFHLGGSSTSFNRRRVVLDTVTRDVTGVRLVMER